jgi:hypothetical protein
VSARKLSLRAERLAELSTPELESVVGGISGILCLTNLCPTWDCTGCHLTCGC